MYKVYLDDVLIHSPADYIVLDNPVLELADNSAGSFTFDVYEDCSEYERIKAGTGIISVYRDDEVLFKGRIINVEQEFDKSLTVKVEGVLAYLDDSVQRPAEYHESTVYGYLQKLIENHNAQVEEDKRFELGQVTVVNQTDQVYRYTNWESTLTAIKDDLISSLGGHIMIRFDGNKRIIDFLADYPRLSKQKIEFGANLLSYTESKDKTAIATVCIPLGAQIEDSTSDIEVLEERVTIADVNDGLDYLELPEAVEKYGRIVKTVTYDDVNDPNNLKTKGLKWLQNNQFEDLELTLTAVDLADFGVEVDCIRLLDRIRCTSRPHGMDREFPLVEMKINLSDPKQNVYTLGSAAKTFTSSTTRSTASIQKQIETLPTKRNILKQAADNAAAMLNNAGKDGHVIFSPSLADPKELYITDAGNLAEAVRLWRWNEAGLGFSEDGGKTYKTAITMDGWINGQALAAGSVYAEQIDAEYTQEQEKKWQDTLDNEYYNIVQTQTAINNSAEAVKLWAEEKSKDYTDESLSGYYTKSEIDLLSDGIKSTAESYTNTALGSYYTKSEIDLMTDSIKLEVSKAGGNPNLVTNGYHPENQGDNTYQSSTEIINDPYNTDEGLRHGYKVVKTTSNTYAFGSNRFPISADKNYVISFKAKKAINVKTLEVRLACCTSSQLTGGGYTTGWGSSGNTVVEGERFVKKLTLINEDGSHTSMGQDIIDRSFVAAFLYVRISSATDTSKDAYIIIDEIKVEEGTEATAWSASPDETSYLKMDADSIRLQTKTLTWEAENSSLTEDGTLTAKDVNLSGSLKSKSDDGQWVSGVANGGIYTKLSGGVGTIISPLQTKMDVGSSSLIFDPLSGSIARNGGDLKLSASGRVSIADLSINSSMRSYYSGVAYTPRTTDITINGSVYSFVNGILVKPAF